MARKQDIFGVTVDGDISGLKHAMNEAVKVFNSTERSLKNVEKALEIDPTNGDLIEKQAQLYARSIEEVRKAIKQLQKDQKALENDSNFTDKTRLSEKFTDLQKKIVELEKAEKRLIATQKELAKSSTIDKIFDNKYKEKFNEFKKNFEDSNKIFGEVTDSLKNIDDQIKLNPDNLTLYQKRQELLNQAISVGTTTLDNYERELSNLTEDPSHVKMVDELKKEFTETDLKAEQLRKTIKRLTIEAFSQPSPKMAEFMTNLDRTSDKLLDIANKTRAFSTAMAGIGIATIKTSADYESSVADIRRVVRDLTDETVSDLKTIAVETGSAFSDVAEYATIAGALGLAEDEISKFARTMTDLNTATGGAFSGEEGAKGIAVFLKQLNLGIDQAENFGSAISVIGDKYADIGDETVRVATRLTGLNAIVNTNQYELIGLAGVMADLGLSADTNANGINRAFLQLDKTINGGVKNSEAKLKEIANVAGMTSEEFRDAWGKSAVDAFLRFTDGLKSSVFNDINEAIATSDDAVMKYADTLGWSAEQFKRAWGEDSQGVFNAFVDILGELDDEGVVAAKVLGDLGISSVNTAQTMLRLSGSGNEVRKAIELATKAWNENTALTEKSGIIYDTTERKLKGFWESLKQLGVAFGDEFLPQLKDGIDKATALMKRFSELDPKTKSLITTFVALGASISPVSKVMGTLGKTIVGSMRIGYRAVGELKYLLSTPFTATGLLGAVGGITVALGGLAYYAYQKNPVRLLNQDIDSLNSTLGELNTNANAQYSAFAKQIDSTNFYATQIDLLTEKLKDNSLAEDERRKYIELINQHVDSLNSALGSEMFYFDETTGKITSQGEEIGKVKEKFEELAFTAKKQAWLDAHQENLQEAYKNIENANSLIGDATDLFNKSVQDINQSYSDLFIKFEGDAEKVRSYMQENGMFIDTTQFETAKRAWETYYEQVQAAQTKIEEAKQTIADYEAVSKATIENFDTLVADITTQTLTASAEATNLVESYSQAVANRELLASVLDDEQETNSEILTSYDSEIEKLKQMIDYETQKHSKAIEVLGTAKEVTAEEQAIIDYWNQWQPPVKTLTIVQRVVGGYGSIGGSNSGGFGGFDSAGYGDILRNTVVNVRNTMANQKYNSGGYRNKVMLNANFTINSAGNITRNDLVQWGSQLADILNEELGKQI